MSTKNGIQPYMHHAEYYETDKMGIIHHSNYIRWMEEARIDFMGQAGMPYKKIEEMGIICPVLSVSCEYRSMVRFDDKVKISVWIEKYNGVKLEFGYEITDCGTGELRTEGTSTHCFLNQEGRVVLLKREYPDIDNCFRQMMGNTGKENK